jgi:hypothetical protein
MPDNSPFLNKEKLIEVLETMDNAQLEVVNFFSQQAEAFADAAIGDDDVSLALASQRFEIYCLKKEIAELRGHNDD